MNHEAETNSAGVLPWITAILLVLGFVFASYMSHITYGSALLP